MPPLTSSSLAIFGPGLLGGSLLLDARELGFRDLRVWARRESSLEEVRNRGLADVISTDANAVAQGADFMVLCIPVGGMEALARQITVSPLKPGAVVTDVGSVKAPVLSGAGAIFKSAGVEFIGSHPMAGSETAGLNAARLKLYQDAACILTPIPETNPAALARLESFWAAFGCRTTCMDAAHHDALVARISHLPHLAAVAATLASFKPDASMARFAAGGLRDTTRVASGPPQMWCEILMENRHSILPALQDLHQATGDLLEMLAKPDETRLLSCLEEARQLRATRYP